MTEFREFREYNIKARKLECTINNTTYYKKIVHYAFAYGKKLLLPVASNLQQSYKILKG